MRVLQELRTDQDVRRFLTTFVVQSRVFRADDYLVPSERARAMRSWDDVLDELRAADVAPGAALSARQEEALKTLPRLGADASKGADVPSDLLTLSSPFSWVKPVAIGELEVLRSARSVLLLVTSPHHGSEVFAQSLVGVLGRAFPGAPIDVATSCPLLWARPPGGVRRVEAMERGAELAPFARALEENANDGRLVVFVESERGATFRNLEALRRHAPFVYIDVENALVRVVDPAKGVGAELKGHGSRIDLATALDDALGQLGWSAPDRAPLFRPRAPRPLLVDVSRARARWFCDVDWMAESVSAVVTAAPHAFSEVLAFAQGDAEEHARAARLGERLAGSLLPCRQLDSAAAALDAAFEGAVVIGPEGLLTPLGHVAPSLSVTIGAKRPFLKLAPSPTSLSVLGGELPGQVARLLGRFLREPTAPERAFAHAIAAALGAIRRDAARAQASDAIRAAGRVAAEWSAADSTLARDFAESTADAAALVAAATASTSEGEGPGWERLLRRARVMWRASNFGRYVAWVVALDDATHA